MSALLLLLLQASDKDAERAVKDFRAALAGSDASSRTAFAAKALETPHERVVRAVAELLAGDTDDVRIGVATLLGETDHPASADALVRALAQNEKRPEVASAIARALGELGWQSACPALEALLKRAEAEDVRAFLPAVLDALGRLGSPGSLEPLLDLLRLVEGPRRAPWAGEPELRIRAALALAAITGVRGRDAREFEEAWKAQQEKVRAGAKKTWWLKKSGERTELPAAEKGPADTLLVATRYVDPPPERRARLRRKK